MQAVEVGVAVEVGQGRRDESMNSEVDSELYRRRTCMY